MVHADKSGEVTKFLVVNFESLIPSFLTELNSLGRSPMTVDLYLLGITSYRKWLENNDRPSVIVKQLVQEWIIDMAEKGAAPATQAARLAGLRQFTKWVATANEIPRNPLLG
jgi:site-specific recombinase XerD